MPALKLTPAKRCYVYLCNEVNQSQPRIFNNSKHEIVTVKKLILFVVRSINHAGAVCLIAVGNVNFDWVVITFQIPLRQKKIVSTVAAFKSLKFGLFPCTMRAKRISKKTFYIRLSEVGGVTNPRHEGGRPLTHKNTRHKHTREDTPQLNIRLQVFIKQLH